MDVMDVFEMRHATKEEIESIDNYIRKISNETGIIYDGVIDSAIKSYENAKDNYLQGYGRGKEDGMKIAAQEILDYINLLRLKYGNDRQRDSVMKFIQDRFNL